MARDLAPEDVIASVRAKGAKTTVDEIWSSERHTRQLLAGVRAAQPRWLDAAQALAPGADGDASEALNDAMAVALPTAPYRLLPLLKRSWWKKSNSACVFDYDSELPGGVGQYVARLRRELAPPAPQELEPLRQECLRGLQQTENNLKAAPK